MICVAKRIIKQISHDKRSIGMIILVPLFLLALMYLLLGKSSYIPTVMTDNIPQPLVTAMESLDTITLTDIDKTQSHEDILKNGNADAIINQDASGIQITMLEPDSIKMSAVTNAIKEAAGQLNPQGQTDIRFIYGDKDESAFDSLGFLLMGVLSFFIIFLFSGISFVRERTSDTVERLMLTPIKTVSVVSGYVVGFSVFALIQSTLVIIFAKFVLKMPFAGEWWCALLIMLLISIMAVVMGVLISAVSKNEFQVMQFIPVIIVPQIFFSGLIPIDTLPFGLNHISKIIPLYYGCTGLKGVLVYGYGLTEVLPQITVLCGITAVLFIANILAVKKYRAV